MVEIIGISIHFKILGEKTQNRKTEIKIRIEINRKKTNIKIRLTNFCWFFEKTNKTAKHLVKLIKNKKREKNNQSEELKEVLPQAFQTFKRS